MTMREYNALRAQYRHSIERAQSIAATIIATLHNGMFQTDGVPWIAADFLGSGSREDRKAMALIERYAIHKANVVLASIKPGDTEGLPAWALGDKQNG